VQIEHVDCKVRVKKLAEITFSIACGRHRVISRTRSCDPRALRASSYRRLALDLRSKRHCWLYMNFFVFVAQTFQKGPALKAMAPTQSESPFVITQLVVMASFVVLGIFAVKGFHAKPVRGAVAFG
jgi:hypothetical protein